MKIDVLGTKWSVTTCSEKDDDRLRDCDGYCDWTIKKIVAQKEVEGTLEDMDCYVKKVLRHEIVHAFLIESGLHECSGESVAWAANEAMVDWFARQGLKIYAAWKEAGAI